MRRVYLVLGLLALCVLAMPVSSFGHEDYAPQGPFVAPAPGDNVPLPTQVPGKEWSNKPDLTTVPTPHFPAPGQTILWDGVGSVKDGVRFTTQYEVDGQANHLDALFHELLDNTAHLVFSTLGDQYQGFAARPLIYEHRDGTHGLWATSGQVSHEHSQQEPMELNSVEVWGPEGISDTDRFSLADEPGGVSIFRLDGSTMYTQLQIYDAIGLTGSGVPVDAVDVDGLMVYEPTIGYKEIIFSIEPISTLFDGGEIWYWDGVNPASFLNHGGHLWNTAFSVMTRFGTASEDVDAIEAISYVIPEPATMTLLALGLGAALLRRRMK